MPNCQPQRTLRRAGCSEHVDERAGLAVVAKHLAGALTGDVEIAVRTEYSPARLAQAAAAGGHERAQSRECSVVLKHVVGALVGDVQAAVRAQRDAAEWLRQAACDHAEECPG